MWWLLRISPVVRAVAVSWSRVIRTAVAGADAEVVHVSGAAEADLAAAVDVVEADPAVRPGQWGYRLGRL